MISKWIPLALSCLLGGWSVRAVSPTREIEIVQALNDSVELWLPLHGDDPLSNNILSGENIDANVRPGGDPSFVEDRWFGAVFQCGPLSSLAIEGFGESAAGSLSPSSFSVSFWFRTNTSTGGSGVMQDLVWVPIDGDTHLHVWLADGDLWVGDGRVTGLDVPDSLSDGRWHHVTITSGASSVRDGSAPEVVDVYLEGVQVSNNTVQVSANVEPGVSDLLVCDSVVENGRHVLDGHVLDLVVFDRTLSREEVVLNYNLRDNPFVSSSSYASFLDGESNDSPAVCSDEPIAGIITTTDCGEGHECYKLHARQFSELRSDGSLLGYEGSIGMCAPESRMTDMLPGPGVVPPPLAFFPLNMDQLWSWPLGIYKGDHRGVSLVSDELFGQALYCNGSEYGFAGLDSVPYGVGGRWSINIWFRPDEVSDKEHSWLFSHGDTGTNPYGANQVQMYLTESKDGGSPSGYGHITASVHDGNDQVSLRLDGVDAVPVLNGDGTVGEFLRANASDGAWHDIHDGEWHMMTLTTNVDGQKGFVLYLDGEEVNALTREEAPRNFLGKEFEVHGGDPLVITNEMLLCGRGYDSAGETFPFHGRLAFLSLWDTRLTPDEVSRLYTAVTAMGATDVANPTEEFDLVYREHGPYAVPYVRYTDSGQKCEFPAIWAGASVYDCVTHEDGKEKCFVNGSWEECADKYGDGDAIIETERADMMNRVEPGDEWDLCLLSVAPNDAATGSAQGCNGGLMCVPLEEGQAAVADEGRCQPAPGSFGSFHVFNYLHQIGMDHPLTLYPLLDESLDAVTVPSHAAIAEDIIWERSAPLGSSAPMCVADASKITLDVGVTNNGEHTDCVWFAPVDTDGGAERDPCSLPPRQILMSHKMLEVGLEPVTGSVGEYALFLLANGSSSTAQSPSVTTGGSPNDEQWHFVCLTTSSTSDVSNIDMYLDGRHVKAVSGEGGLYDGITTSSVVSLCPSFNGQVAHYIGFGEALAANEIRSLYTMFDESGIVQGMLGFANGGSDGGLSGAEIAGVVIGSVLLGALLFAVVLAIVKHRSQLQQPASVKRDKDSNVILPNDDALVAPDVADQPGDLERDGEKSLRQKFSAHYPPSDLHGGSLSREFSAYYQPSDLSSNLSSNLSGNLNGNLSGVPSGNLSRQFSYGYDQRETMPLANPDPAHAEKPPGVSTPDDPPASVDNATAEDKSSSDSGTDS